MNITHSGNTATMNSREIAALTGKRHDNVKRTIESLVESGVIESPQIEEIPTTTKPVAVYVFSGERGKRDSIVVVAQLSPEFTARLVDRWQELEAKQAQPVAMPSYAESLRLLADQIEETARVTVERDLAVATKALIGSKREATAMNTAAQAKREAAQLRDQLGFNCRHATILAVEHATGGEYGFIGLRRWCKANGVTPETVPDKRYPAGVKAWPAAAWLAVYGIELVELFSAEVAA